MRRGSFAPLSLAVVLACAALGASCAQDPVHDNEVSALGAEQPGVSPGPTHRPGQPCLVCHGGDGPAGTEFSAGGTVYTAQTGTATPSQGTVVNLLDAANTTVSAITNEAGNFYVLKSQWSPVFPVDVSITYAKSTASMGTHIGRDASCASCHYDPPGPETPGRVYTP